MANNFIDISVPLDENNDSFPKNSQRGEVAENSPFQGGSIFQEQDEEVFPLERKFGKTAHYAKNEK